MSRFSVLVFTVLGTGLAVSAAVTNTIPANAEHTVAWTNNVVAQFSENLRGSTITSNKFFLYSIQKGCRYGSISFNGSTNQVTLNPAADFKAGEPLVAELTRGITNAAGTTEQPWYSWSFRAAVQAGGGVFTTQYLGSVSTNKPYTLALGDLTGDGWLDCFVVAYNGAGAQPNRVYTNDRSGFLYETGQNLLWPANIDVQLGDADRDGDLDAFIVHNSTNAVDVWTNNGAGMFGISTHIGTGSLYRVALGDVNGDGWLDAIPCYQVPLSAEVWTNNRAGRFYNSNQHLTNATAAILADVNGDGFNDAILGTYSAGVAVWTNNGNGVFASASTWSDGTRVMNMDTGDIDGDGDLDVVLSRSGSSLVALTNNGLGRFSQGAAVPAGTSYLKLADMNGDGALDIVTATNLCLNNGAGVFTLDPATHFRSASGNWGGLDAGDLDNDGDLDLAMVYQQGSGYTYIYRNHAPAMSVLGTNGAVIASDATPSSANGSDFGTVDIGSSPARTFAIANTSAYALTVGGVSTNGTGAAYFSVGDVPATVAAGTVSNFTIAFSPAVAGAATASVDFLNNSTCNLYRVSVQGAGAAATRVIDASAGAHGSIVPSGLVQVNDGASTSFVIMAEAYYWIDSVLTNGAEDAAAAHTRIYTSRWVNITADGTVSVSFAEALAAHGTPEWWLAQYGWTNNFDSWETNDTDNDTFEAWQEQIAGTDPTNGGSRFQVSSFEFQVSNTVVTWDAVTDRTYSVEGNTNLSQDWLKLATNLPPIGVWTDTVHGGEQMINYRLGVTKP
mgnify:CR=1 FL=1